jgi:ferric-dicitrate binding protein FerR (iron transport regulator)
VNAYENEQTLNTTLLEGKVLVKKQQEQLALLPGQQAEIRNDHATKITLRKTVDIDKVMAWKNGLFNFEDQPLQEIMRQLERWYDIDVIYEKGVPDIELAGEISKGTTLNGLLTGLAELGLHYRLEGRKLVVLP